MAILTLSLEERKRREQELRNARRGEARGGHEPGEILDEEEKPEPPDPTVMRVRRIQPARAPPRIRAPARSLARRRTASCGPGRRAAW
jgi:hypothetical protein